jgi:hypothetical protein
VREREREREMSACEHSVCIGERER